jgi:hypothetical protein
MVREWEFSLVNSSQQGRLAAAVLAEQTISSAVGDFESGVVEQHFAVEHQTGRCDLDISAGFQTRKHTGRDTVADAVVILLQLQFLNLLVDLEVVGVDHGWAIVAVHRGCLGGDAAIGLRGDLGRGLLLVAALRETSFL